MKEGQIRVKICGITHSDDLEAVEGADMVGIVIQVPGSLRSRSLEEARALVRAASGRWTVVGVLVEPPLDLMHQVWEDVGADWIQVHGKLPEGLARADRERVVPSIGIPPPHPGQETGPPGGKGVRGDEVHPFVHLDTASGPLPGGTGHVSDWSRCRSLVEAAPKIRFMLGGGLTPANVTKALDAVGPRGVDVSSGVESRPGRKSRARTRSFISQVREWEALHA